MNDAGFISLRKKVWTKGTGSAVPYWATTDEGFSL
jgi:hypothetical protein